MFVDIKFLSIGQVKRLKYSNDTVVVSILDDSEQRERPPLRGFRATLKLCFEDSYEEAKLAKAGDWPDEPTDEEHAKYCQSRGERVPTLTDATRIASFLDRYARAEIPLKLVVHCYGGVSRSAAVALWAANRYGVNISTAVSTGNANKRLLRLLDKAVPP